MKLFNFNKENLIPYKSFDELISQNMVFILSFVFLAIVTIANRYYCERQVREIYKLEQSLKTLKLKHMTISCEQMRECKESQVEIAVKQKNIPLQKPTVPPITIED